MLTSKRSAGRASATVAAALVARGAKLGMRLEGLQPLQSALDKHAEWGASVQKALSSEQSSATARQRTCCEPPNATQSLYQQLIASASAWYLSRLTIWSRTLSNLHDIG